MTGALIGPLFMVLLVLFMGIFAGCTDRSNDSQPVPDPAAPAGRSDARLPNPGEIPPATASSASRSPRDTRGKPATWVELERLVDSWHRPRAVPDYFMPDIMGSGAALLDANGDGWLDILALNATPSNERDGPPRNQLFLQQPPAEAGDHAADGYVTAAQDLQFQEFTESGLDVGASYAVGLAVGDLDQDGDLDVYISCYGPDHLFLNDGQGNFSDVTDAAGIANPHWGTAVCMFDYDRDGWLDILVVNYLDYHPGNPCEDGLGRQDYCGPSSFSGTVDKLFRNRTVELGRVAFEDVTIATGLVQRSGRGLGAYCSDLTGDGRADIYIANDMEANFLWSQNLGSQKGEPQNGELIFQEEAVQRGVAWNGAGDAEASMGIACADFNGDRRQDLFLTHLRGETNTLYSATGANGQPAGTFIDASAPSGLGTTSLQDTGFGVVAQDFDHDGDVDCAIGNGRVKRASQQFAAGQAESVDGKATFWRDYAEANRWFLNEGNGRYRDASAEAPAFTMRSEVTRALVVGDLDRDGDLDLVQTNCGGPLRIFRNDLVQPGDPEAASIQVEARTADNKRLAIGARVRVTFRSDHQTRCVTGELQPSSSYLSSHAPRLHFGLGRADRIEQLEVTWPTGEQEVFDGGSVQRLYTLVRGRGRSFESEDGGDEP